LKIISYKFNDDIEIYPLADLHFGDALCNLKNFRSFLNHINESNSRYIICAGDLINNNLLSSVGSPYDDIIAPGDQKRKIREELKKVKDRILVMIGGNHEYRTKRNADIDITEDIADFLEVPYQEDVSILKITVGKIDYLICITHGNSGGRRPGANLNSIEMISLNYQADIYIVGHSHKVMAHKALTFIPDGNKVKEMEQLYCNTGGWLNYGGYARRKLYRPQVRGSVQINLSSKKKLFKAVI
jgi:predicted phosphodiesterase